WLRTLLAWTAVGLGLTGVALAGAGAMVHPRILTAGVVLLGSGAVLWQWVQRRQIGTFWLAVAVVPLIVFLAVELCLRPVVSTSPAAALTAKLLPDPLMKRRVYALNLSPSYQAQIRVFSGGR